MATTDPTFNVRTDLQTSIEDAQKMWLSLAAGTDENGATQHIWTDDGYLAAAQEFADLVGVLRADLTAVYADATAANTATAVQPS